MKIEEALKDLCRSANISLDEIDASQIGEIMRKTIREKEKKVVAVLGEPAATQKSGREGTFYRYRRNAAKGITKDIVRKDRSAVIQEAYQILYGEAERLKEMTVSDVFKEWYEGRTTKKSSKTCAMDMSFWNAHLRNTELARMKLASVRAEHIEETLDDICNDHRIARSTLNPLITILKGIWSKGVSKGIVDINLPKNMDFREIRLNTKQPKSEVQKQEEVYRDDEINELRDHLWLKDRDIYDNAILFLSYLGVRIAEMRALTWDDYDPLSGEIRITHEIVKRKKGNKTYVDEDVPHTKGYAALGQRKFQLPTPCRMILEQMRMINGDKKYIFQSEGIYPINPNHLNARLKKHCKHLGIRYFSSHKFRFYWISRAYELRIDERIIQMVAGHASVEMTRKYNRSTHKREMLTQTQMDSIAGFVHHRSPSSKANEKPLKRIV